MNLLQLEKRIREAITNTEVLINPAAGFGVSWRGQGYMLVEPQKGCCPMGAVLIDFQKAPKMPGLLSMEAARVLGITDDEVLAFAYGFDNTKLSLRSAQVKGNVEMWALGFKFRQEAIEAQKKA